MDRLEMVDRLRFKLGDEGKIKFTDDSGLSQEIIEAMHKHNPDYTELTVPENEEYLILKLALISCFYTLAGREAKNYAISVDGISIAKGERVKNYLSMADTLSKEYVATINGPDYQSIEVGNFKRYSAVVDGMVGGA